MTLSRIPLAIPNVGPAEAANLQACIDENFVSTVGRFVTELEEKCAALSGTAHGIATGAGTQALHMALLAMNIGAGDLVILPSFTFIASANAISHSGAKPWLMDISPSDWILDPEVVSWELDTHCDLTDDGACLHRETGLTVKAIMPVYTMGTPADMVALRAIAEKWNLRLIADAAAAIGVTIGGKPLGGFADATCYSFNGNKTITCGGGGMIVGNDHAIMKRARHLTTTARTSPNYDHDEIGYNYRMTNIEAAVGCAQFDRLAEFLTAKRIIRERYNSAFANTPGISVFPETEDRSSTCWFSGFVFDDPDSNVPAFCAELSKQMIEARPFWKPVHLQTPYASAPRSSMDVSGNLWSRIVTLPCSTSLTEADQARVIAAVADLLEPVRSAS
jgi:dTDP-4-amino-4,6-dideoxygalactose transaminase